MDSVGSSGVVCEGGGRYEVEYEEGVMVDERRDRKV